MSDKVSSELVIKYYLLTYLLTYPYIVHVANTTVHFLPKCLFVLLHRYLITVIEGDIRYGQFPANETVQPFFGSANCYIQM